MSESNNSHAIDVEIPDAVGAGDPVDFTFLASREKTLHISAGGGLVGLEVGAKQEGPFARIMTILLDGYPHALAVHDEKNKNPDGSKTPVDFKWVRFTGLSAGTAATASIVAAR